MLELALKSSLLLKILSQRCVALSRQT